MSEFNVDDFLDDALAGVKSKISIDPAPSSSLMDSVAVNETVQDLSQLDTVAILAEVKALEGTPQEKRFKVFVRGFKPSALPKGAQKAFSEFTDEQKIVWLFLRWRALSDLMFLATNVELRLLTQAELERCIGALVADPTIEDVRYIPSSVIGCQLNTGMVAQLKDVLARDEQFRKLFPDVIARVGAQETRN
jgi:hypothetical protein